MDGVLVDFEKGYMDRVNERDPEYLKTIGYVAGTDVNTKNIEDFMQADFERKAPNAKEKAKAKYRASNKFWSFVRGDVQWWVNLPWMPDGRELFNNLYTLRQNGIIGELSILSAPSKTDPIVPAAKHKWIAKYGLTDKLDRIIIDGDKFKYAESHNDILIDDTQKKLDAWISAGGTGILHTSTAKTLEELNKYLLKDSN